MNQLNNVADTPEYLAAECLIKLRTSSEYPRDEIASLVRLASSKDEQVAERATTAIFTSLIEPLADSFEEAAVTQYNRVFAQLIAECLDTEDGAPLKSELVQYGLADESDLRARAEMLRTVPRLKARVDGRQPRRIIVLSRVTVGADVAITSVIVERLKRRFAEAEIILLGGQKLSELFGGDPRVSFSKVTYERSGRLLQRLLSWVELLKSIRSLTGDLQPGEWMIVDPDSRLTQLGLLPLTTPEADGSAAYLFFPSREYGAATSQPLAVLTARWLDAVFGEQEATAPGVWLTPADVEVGRSIATAFRGSSDRPVVAINFGVGANPAKSVGTWFEAAIVATLLSDGAKIILDRGAGEDEARRVDALISFARDNRVRVHEVNEASLESLEQGSSSLPADGDLLVWTGRLGLLAALIAESDLYIGYDSAGQHLAAALGIPCIDVMGGYGSERIVDRWRPRGSAETRVILVSGSVLEETIHHSREMLAKREAR